MQNISDILNQKLAEVENQLSVKREEVIRLEALRKELLELMEFKQIRPQPNVSVQTVQPKRSAARKENQVQILFKLVPELIRQSDSGQVKAGEINEYIQRKGGIVGEGATARIANILFACVQRSDCPFKPVVGKKGYYEMK